MRPSAKASQREGFAAAYGTEHEGRDTASGIGAAMRPSAKASQREGFAAAYGTEHEGRDTASGIGAAMRPSAKASQREGFASTYGTKYWERDTASTQMDLVLGGSGSRRQRPPEPAAMDLRTWWPTDAPDVGPGSAAATTKPNHQAVDLARLASDVTTSNTTAAKYKRLQKVSQVFDDGKFNTPCQMRRPAKHPALRRQVALGGHKPKAVESLVSDDGEAKFLQARRRVDPTHDTEYGDWDYLKSSRAAMSEGAEGAGGFVDALSDTSVPDYLLRSTRPDRVARLDEGGRFRSGWKVRRPLAAMALWDDSQLAYLAQRRERSAKAATERRERLRALNTEYNGFNVVTGEDYRSGLSPKTGRRAVDIEEQAMRCDVRLARRPRERVADALGLGASAGAWSIPMSAARPVSTVYGAGKAAAGTASGRNVHSAAGRLVGNSVAPVGAGYSVFPRVEQQRHGSASSARLQALSRGSGSGQRQVPNPRRHRGRAASGRR